jgi:hypothetical protein
MGGGGGRGREGEASGGKKQKKENFRRASGVLISISALHLLAGKADFVVECSRHISPLSRELPIQLTVWTLARTDG